MRVRARGQEKVHDGVLFLKHHPSQRRLSARILLIDVRPTPHQSPHLLLLVVDVIEQRQVTFARHGEKARGKFLDVFGDIVVSHVEAPYHVVNARYARG